MVIQKDGSTRQVQVQSGNSVGELVIVKGDLKVGEVLQSK